MTRTAIIGGGIAGLTAAWELARSGHQVDLYEAGSRLGGAIAPVALSGVRVDAGAEAFATRTPAVVEFLRELGLEDQVISPNPLGAWLQLPDQASPMPATGVLGVPANPRAEDVIAILGAEHAARAAADFDSPMRWSAAQNPALGEVVADRMGPAVVERLVAPITSGVHSADPYELAISSAHPELYRTMLAEGSLARAVASLRRAAPAGSAVQSLHGGMNTLISALESQLRQLGANIHLNTEVQDLGTLEADAVIVATEAPQVRRLISGGSQPAGLSASRSPGEDSGVALVTLLLHAPEMDVWPRGTGMLVAPTVRHIRAKAMTHISAKWEWVAQALEHQLGPSHHLLRLSFGRVTDTAGSLGFRSSDSDLLGAAITDLPALTSIAVSHDQLVDHTVVRWQAGLPGGSPQQRSDAQHIRELLRARHSAEGPRIAVTGAWFSGTGLAQIIPDARRTAQQILAP
ncbi:protoporphyrinogen oxidase [Nesterenkonia natronophila]|uniref:Coproporphyrinogen III oxidase n=1 Tax=Nesterenkonia natronophila TaxID=2174932 RepID=A0A3A4F226_9MICC|nr:protoporphyrinogen oxidase [Nesterenkonia natronophila]RJN31761.1 protoporphyrinogen oxidase [Nesterenkonia natronophila]